jgi:hypothetical protein
MNYNNENPGEKERYPPPPQVFYRKGGETYYWTEEEYAALTKLSGEIARNAIMRRADKFDPENPTLRQIEAINQICARARAQAKALVLSGRY